MSDFDVKPDITSRQDIKTIVDRFYEKAFADDLLRPIFVDAVHLDLKTHAPIICDFWEKVLFRANTYNRNAFAVHHEVHEKASLNQEHFDRWVFLWESTVHELHEGEKAEFAIDHAKRVAGAMLRRLQNGTESDKQVPIRFSKRF